MADELGNLEFLYNLGGSLRLGSLEAVRCQCSKSGVLPPTLCRRVGGYLNLDQMHRPTGRLFLELGLWGCCGANAVVSSALGPSFFRFWARKCRRPLVLSRLQTTTNPVASAELLGAPTQQTAQTPTPPTSPARIPLPEAEICCRAVGDAVLYRADAGNGRNPFCDSAIHLRPRHEPRSCKVIAPPNLPNKACFNRPRGVTNQRAKDTKCDAVREPPCQRR